MHSYDVIGLTWFWVCGPKGLPAAVAQRLATEVRRIVSSQTFKRVHDRDVLVSPDLTGDALMGFIAADFAQWRPLIGKIGNKVQ